MSGSAACSSGVSSLLQLPLSAQVPMLRAGGAGAEGLQLAERLSPAAGLSDALLCGACRPVSIGLLCLPLCLATALHPAWVPCYMQALLQDSLPLPTAVQFNSSCCLLVILVLGWTL